MQITAKKSHFDLMLEPKSETFADDVANYVLEGYEITLGDESMSVDKLIKSEIFEQTFADLLQRHLSGSFPYSDTHEQLRDYMRERVIDWAQQRLSDYEI